MFKLTLIASVLATLALVKGQASGLPDVTSIPAACGTQCGDIIEVATLCSEEYTSALNITACVCNALPSTSSLNTCSTCLSSNNAAGLSTALSQASSACTSALDMCAFECGSIPTCASGDTACECSRPFLQGIYNCGSCNTANGNNNQTSLADYTSLANACVNQNFTNTPSATQDLPSPTGQAQYQAPTLTGTGGGSVSATRASTGLGSVTSTVVRSTSLGATTAVTGSLSRTVSVSTPLSASVTRSVTGSGSGAASGVPAASSTGAAVKNVVAIGGVLGGVLAVVGLF